MKLSSLFRFTAAAGITAFACSPMFTLAEKPAGAAKAAEAPAEEAPAADPETITLFDGKSLDGWKRVDCGGSGEVTLDKKKGTLDIGFGESISGAVYQKAADLPKTNYEISLQAKRVDGTDFFCGLTFPVGDLKTCATLIVGGWGGGVTGISSLDGLDASENETGDYVKIEDGVWYQIRLRVTPDRINVWLGEDEIIDVGIKDRKISMRPGDIELYMPLSLTNFQTSSSFKDITITPIPAEPAEK